MSRTRHPKAYVRVAQPSEHDVVTRVLTRAFANDPAMNWYGCVQEVGAVTDLDSPTHPQQKTLRNLRWFQSAISRVTTLVDGVVTVVAIPQEDEEAGPESSTKTDNTPDGKKSKEKIIAVALWLPPGRTLDMGPITFIRCGTLKVLQGWGFTGLKRVLVDFSPAVEHTLERAFKARGLDRLDSWHLLEMVVDPDHQGLGYCSILMEEGFRRTSPRPVHLEATKAATRDIYARFGFEVDEEHQFGVRAVDKNGIKALGEAATGYPEWIMTKWST